MLNVVGTHILTIIKQTPKGNNNGTFYQFCSLLDTLFQALTYLFMYVKKIN